MDEKEEKVIQSFEAIRPALEAWGAHVDETLMQVLEKLDHENHVKIYPKHRVKNSNSFLAKALYRKKTYTNYLLEIEDKVGTRVVLLKSDDIYLAAKLILDSTAWSAKTTKNLKEIIEEKPNEFDYQSVHIVVRPNEGQWDSTIQLDYLTCEIQIRTLLQHAFAEVSHDSTYKGPYKNDKEIMRKLAKSMALMEATDDYFCSIFEMMTDEKRWYRNYINELIHLYQNLRPDFNKGELDVELTDTILELYQPGMNINEIQQFIEKNRDQVEDILEMQKGFLVQQPVFLFAYFLVFNYPTLIKKNWPLSQFTLDELFILAGVSKDSY
jgi:ppGpp synthetase/RelA/SpoT-type nucleotidyltranferase